MPLAINPMAGAGNGGGSTHNWRVPLSAFGDKLARHEKPYFKTRRSLPVRP